jgi:serine/threonine-protein kinase RsbW
VRTRLAASTLLGVTLVALVAVATVVVAWLLWSRAEDRGRVEDDRAALTASEALQGNLGRILAGLRAAAGLVDAEGEVDVESFRSYARAIGSIGSVDALGLAEIVPGGEREAFEIVLGRRISQTVRPGVFRSAEPSDSYVPIVAVWPDAGVSAALLGFDLESEPRRRATVERARASRDTVVAGVLPFVWEGEGLQAIRPIYAPTADDDDAPIGFVSAWFGPGAIADALARVPTDVRARVTLDGELLFETDDPPDGGETRSIALADRRLVVTARAGEVSHASSLAILAGGAILALMLGAFLWARASSERRLLRANEAERAARRQAEMMERSAARLATAATVGEVGATIVGELEAAGANVVFVWRSRDDATLAAFASSPVPDQTRARFALYPLEVDGIVSDAMRTRRLVDVGSSEEYDRRYPAMVEERRRLGLESLVALPLRAAAGNVVGAILAGSTEPGWVDDDRRRLLLGVAEQTGVALERAVLQASAERTAAASGFLVQLGEALERETTVVARARRLVEAVTEEWATFCAVHLLDDDGGPVETASGGSRPAELSDDARWGAIVEGVVASGRETRPEGADAAPSAAPALVVVPLRARGHVLGALTIRSAPGPDWRPVLGPGLAREVAARAAVALDNALRYESERDVSHALQLGLLGGELPSFEGVVVASAYRPGTAALEVGGDWYDAFPLESGAVALVVGDVVGHGLEAAVAMGQLRGAVSALAQTAGPAILLERLDGFVETVPSAATATLAYVELDRATGRIRYACAGHPPPLVVSPDGRARFLWDGRSAPLGSMLGAARGEAEEHLAPGETLVLYTDGLVERRSAAIDVGLERLARAARLHSHDASLAETLCDSLLDGQVQDDDVCVLTIQCIPLSSMFSHSFSARPDALAELRTRLRTWLREHDVGDEVERGVVLAVSEAAANAVEHAYGSDGAGIVTVMAVLDDDGVLEITVRDEGTWRDGDSDPDRGRGLSIMRTIADRLSVERGEGATVLRMVRTARESASA